MSARSSSAINIIGLFTTAEEAGEATRDLAKGGFSSENVEVMSGVPLPHGAFASRVGRSRIPYFSLFGAAAGLVGGLALAVGTALLYPLPTGGKPIVAWPTVGVILYEVTMLGIMLMTALAFMLLARLPRRQPSNYAANVSDGEVSVAVRTRSENVAAQAERILQGAGAHEVLRGDRIARRWEDI
ncbi:MAG: quinol:electron acceptor oxidoreductase subunit ActD [Chloroflexota bacterium]